MVRISEQTGFGYLRLSKGELENEKDLLACLERGEARGLLEVLSEKSDCLVNEKRLLASLGKGVGKRASLLRSFQKNPIVW